MRIERNTVIQQPVVDRSDAKTTKEDQAKSENLSTQNFTSANVAVATDARGTSSSQASILRSFLEGQLKVDVPRPQNTPAPPTDSSKTEPTVGMANPDRSSSVGASNTVLKPGDKNDQVLDLQIDLNKWRRENGLPSIPTNGDYNAETEQAVRDFQKTMGLQEDGKAGPNVKARLSLESNKDFEQLDPQVKDLIRNDFNQLQNDPEKRDNLVKLATNREFANMISPSSEVDALSAFINTPGDTENLERVKNAVTDVAILEKKNTLGHVPEETQKEVISTLFYETTAKKHFATFDRGDAREEIMHLATDPEFAKLSQSDQSKMLEGIRGSNDQRSILMMRAILNSPGYKNMDEGMKSRVIQLANENATYTSLYATKTNHDGDDYDIHGLEGLKSLLQDPNFIDLPPEQQSSQLNAFKTVPPDSDLVY